MEPGRDQSAFYDRDEALLSGRVDARIERILAFTQGALERRRRRSGVAGERCLDIGCGGGGVLARLEGVGERHGVDLAAALVDEACGRGIRAVVVDVDRDPLPYPARGFDLVLATDVIEHVLHTDRLLNEISRVLKPDGLFVACVPNINQPVSWLLQWVLDLTPMYGARYRATHYRDFTHRLFKAILRAHGFRVERAQGVFVWPFSRSRISRGMASLMPRLGAHIVYAARKDRDAVVDEGFTETLPQLLRWLRAAGDRRVRAEPE